MRELIGLCDFFFMNENEANLLFGGADKVQARPGQIIFVLPGTMIIWFSLLRPLVRRRYWKQVQTLTRSWKLRPEKAA